MSQVATVESITVLQIGKFGIRVDEKTWYGVNEPLTPSHFAVGTTYQVSISTSKTGKKYVKELLSASDVTTPPVETAKVAAPVDTARAERVIESALKKPALDLKTTQIQRQGLFQAALQSPALTTWAVNPEEYLSLVRKVAEAGVRFVNE